MLTRVSKYEDKSNVLALTILIYYFSMTYYVKSKSYLCNIKTKKTEFLC